MNRKQKITMRYHLLWEVKVSNDANVFEIILCYSKIGRGEINEMVFKVKKQWGCLVGNWMYWNILVLPFDGLLWY